MATKRTTDKTTKTKSEEDTGEREDATSREADRAAGTRDTKDREVKHPGPRDEKQPPTDDKQPPTDGKNPPTDEKQPPTDEKRPPTDEREPPVDEKPAAGDDQPPAEVIGTGQRAYGAAGSSVSGGDDATTGSDPVAAAGSDQAASVRDIGIEGLATSGMRADVDRLAGTLDSRIAETISTEAATSSVEYGTGSVTSGGDAAQDVSSDAASSMPDVPRWNAVDQSTGRGSSTSSS